MAGPMGGQSRSFGRRGFSPFSAVGHLGGGGGGGQETGGGKHPPRMHLIRPVRICFADLGVFGSPMYME